MLGEFLGPFRVKGYFNWMGYAKQEMSGHGFRSMASTLLNEQGWNRDAIERQVALPEIEELHSVAGTYSYFAKVRVASPEDLDVFLDQLMMMDGVERTETTMVLRTSAERALPLQMVTTQGPDTALYAVERTENGAIFRRHAP